MTYRTRIGILIAFIALFLVTAPLVVLYTAGYRWNEKKVRLEKVGLIFLRSRPSYAEIYLDGVLRSERTPARLRSLLPSTYDVKVTKKGYTSWEKNLPVGSALTTFAESVVLWKQSAPQKLAADETLSQSEQVELDRAKPLVFAANNETLRSDGFEIWFVDKNGDHETITRLSDEIRAVLPYADNSWAIYETDTAIHSIERDGRDVRNDITLATGDDLSGLALSSDGKYLCYRAGAAIWRRQFQ